jgi:protein-glutamine gamma-glutamyltransferase
MSDRHHLSPQRESRDTLLLIAVLGWTLLPQIGVLPVWSLIYAALALGWRAVLCRTGGGLPPRWILLTALPLAVGMTIWSHSNLLGRDAGTTLLVVLTGLKALEMHTQRDRFVLCFLGFMLVLAAFLQSQTLVQALAMSLSVAGLLTCLLLANRPQGQPALLEAARQALLPPLLGLPLVALLFLFFPRVPPLWSTGSGESARTGLSDRLELGRFVENVLDDAPALQVRFQGPIPAEPERYFRAQVLSVHEDATWTMAHARPDSLLTPTPLPQTEGTLTHYEMTVEPLGVRTLPLLELTTIHPEVEGTTADLVRYKDLHWEAVDPIDQRLRVRAQAQPSGVIQTAASPFPTADLGLPEGLHPRTRTWARAQRERQPHDWKPDQWSEWLLTEIRTGEFSYSLTPGLPRRANDDPVDAFWLDHRQGFCEHYASAYVIVMRELGFPARIVTGYQGGQINPFDQVLEVRQSDAHAWAEYWSAERGWVRVDPTAAVAPERIRESRRLRPPGLGGVLPALDAAALERLRAIWGVVNHRWSLWVVGFTPRQQFDLLQWLGWQDPDPDDLVRVLQIGFAVLLFAGLLISLRPAGRLAALARRLRTRSAHWLGRVPDEQRWLPAWQALRNRLEQLGLPLRPQHGPLRAAQLCRQSWADQPERQQAADQLAEALTAFEAWRYGAATQRSPLNAVLQPLRRQIDRLEALLDRPDAVGRPPQRRPH